MGLHLPRAEAVPADDGRECAWCGAKIDPIDWCPDCQKRQQPCGVHKRLRKRADAAFCDDECRQMNRSTYIRDCLTPEQRRAIRPPRRPKPQRVFPRRAVRH